MKYEPLPAEQLKPGDVIVWQDARTTCDRRGVITATTELANRRIKITASTDHQPAPVTLNRHPSDIVWTIAP